MTNFHRNPIPVSLRNILKLKTRPSQQHNTVPPIESPYSQAQVIKRKPVVSQRMKYFEDDTSDSDSDTDHDTDHDTGSLTQQNSPPPVPQQPPHPQPPPVLQQHEPTSPDTSTGPVNPTEPASLPGPSLPSPATPQTRNRRRRREVWSTSPPRRSTQVLVPLRQPKAKSKGYLSVGERIVVGKGDPIVWTSAILSKKTNTYRESSYYWSWIEEDSGVVGEGFLLQGQPWGVLRGDHSNLSVPHTQFAYNAPSTQPQPLPPQLDGANVTPDSLRVLSPPIIGPILNPGAHLRPSYKPLDQFVLPHNSHESPPPPQTFTPFSVPFIPPQRSRLPLKPKSVPTPPTQPEELEDFLHDWWKPDSVGGNSSSRDKGDPAFHE